ncbi:MAG: shikimate kinase [Eubacteriaceae bacterium]
MSDKKDRIALIGFMATGKTTIGPRLAKELNFDFIDTDEMIEQKTGLKISEIFERFGEKKFRELEFSALKEAMAMEKIVVSTGGGIILSPINRTLLQSKAFVVTLECSPRTVYFRVKNNQNRPLLNKDKNLFKSIEKMMSERSQFYDICDYKISTDRGSANKCCNTIIEVYKKTDLR